MSVCGDSVKRGIRMKLSELQEEEKKYEGLISGYERQIQKLMAEREDAYSSLADICLPSMDASSVKHNLKQVQSRVSGIFEKRQVRRTGLDGLIASSRERRSGLERDLDNVISLLNDKAAERDGLAAKVSDELAENGQYREMKKDAEDSAERIAEAKVEYEHFEKNARRKLAEFEANPLFVYLSRRAYGSEGYHSILSPLDSLVAKKVNYAEASANYSYLKDTTQKLEARIAERQATVKSLVAGVKKIEAEASDRSGLTKVIQEGQLLGSNRSGIIEVMQKAEAEEAKYSSERADLDTSKDPYHIVAISILKDYLKGVKIGELKVAARDTPDIRDDNLVDRVEAIDAQVRAIKDASKQAIADKSRLVKQMSGVQSLLSNFSSRDYDSGRSYFDSRFNVDNLIDGYVAGTYSINQVWSQVSSFQHFEQPAYTYSSDSSGDSGFSSGSGIDCGGGFSSGDGF